nr:reverse transcriptase domain-containing protein [Tanacetum cinerariifolium]
MDMVEHLGVLACNPKDYDGKGSAIVYTRWIEKMESVQDMSGCRDNQKEAAVGMTWDDFKALPREEFCPNNEMQKLKTEFWRHDMVRASHAAYTDRFHEFARLVPHFVTPDLWPCSKDLWDGGSNGANENSEWYTKS